VTTVEQLNVALGERYDVERELGTGGMATVFLARDRKHNRSVALKLLLPELSSVLSASRFQSEIDIVARLQHPNILQLYDSGEAEGLKYYVMPYAEGRSLRDRLQRDGRLSLEHVVKITREVAQALTYAHARGVVHRDIKPENILFFDDVASVSDFGIARMVETAGTRLTQAGMSIGTPQYMSPEQGVSDQVDARSDVYSLACVVYEMLAGAPPFTGESARLIIARHVTEQPANVSAIRSVPEPLDGVLEKALAKNPEERYDSATAFAEALAAAVGTGGNPRAVLLPVSGSRFGSLAAAGITAAVVLFIGWRIVSGDTGGSADSPPKVIILPFEHVGLANDQFIADGLAEEVTSRVASISGLNVIARASALQYKTRTPTLREIGRETGATYVLRASVRTDRGPNNRGSVRVTPHLVRVSDERELWSDGLDATLAPGELFALQSSIAERIAQELNVSLLLPESVELKTIPTSDAAAYEAYLQGNVYLSQRYQEGPARLAVQAFERAVQHDPRFAVAYAKLAEAHALYYFFFDRLPARIDMAQAAVDRAFALDSTLLEGRLARGYVHWWARQNADSAIAVLNQVRRRQPNNSEVLWIIGNIQRLQGHWHEALPTLHRAAELDPRSQVYELDLATSYLVLRNYRQAETHVNKAVALAPDWAIGVLLKSLVPYLRDGDAEAARRIVAQARANASITVTDLLKQIIRRHPQYIMVLGGDIRDSLDALSSRSGVADPVELFLAQAYSFEKRGDSARARAVYDSARVLLEKRVKAAPNEPDFHSMLGIAYAGVGRRADAIREGEFALGMQPLSKDAVRGVFTIHARLRIAMMNGERDVALQHARTMVDIPASVSRKVAQVDAYFDPLRSDPRFAAMVRQPEVRH
jgi:TolB-like protein/Flp pilus assembly protein TadD